MTNPVLFINEDKFWVNIKVSGWGRKGDDERERENEKKNDKMTGKRKKIREKEITKMIKLNGTNNKVKEIRSLQIINNFDVLNWWRRSTKLCRKTLEENISPCFSGQPADMSFL